jgi:hypothetical protein
MPFTLAHGAAALPFRRFGLPTSALLIGTFAPDLEYFLRLTPDDGFGHTLPGIFLLTLPLALVVLWLFHAYVKLAVARLLPQAIQRRLTNHLEFHFGGAARFALIVGSILLGIATHLAWDSFTHKNTWLYRHWPILRQALYVPIIGPLPAYKVLQHGSTIFGIGVLLVWMVVRYRNSEPSREALSDQPSPARKTLVVTIVSTVALMGAIIRAIVKIGIPTSGSSEKQFVALVVVTAIALVWWELVVYGALSLRNDQKANRA